MEKIMVIYSTFKKVFSFVIFLMVLLEAVTALALPLNINKGIEISEIMYDPIVSESGGEWIELFNGTNQSIDLTRFFISDDGGVSFDSISQRSGFQDITNVPAGNFFVITEKDGTVSFSDIYSDFSIYAGVTSSSLSLHNSGEEIILIDSVDFVIGNGNDIILQDFIYPDITAGNSIFKISIMSGNETKAESFSESILSPWGEGLGNPGKINAGQSLGNYPVPEPASIILLMLGITSLCSLEKLIF
ncbi:MAG: lamin tail domain-containing protein [Candidatus Schekmanbacteria bacterium]|nr:MAG: lamin tail domain-containing protein [Candidatus Schekmanbacteria bacterium]